MRIRWNHVAYALILIGIVVGWVYFPARYSTGHFVITMFGVGLLFVVRRLSTGRWSR